MGRGPVSLLLAVLALAVLPAIASAAKKPVGYDVGIASRSINPDRDGKWKGAPVFLGGYGIGGGTPWVAGRAATGYLGDGISVRAIAISDGKRHFAIADIETQGWFVETKDGTPGLLDMRREVARRTNGLLPASSVVVQSDHTHGGPDPIGVWGGIPAGYKQFIAKQTADAIVEAFRSRRRGTLWYGTADGRDLLSNQFDYDEVNKSVDSDVRVLQARDRDGDPFATLLNFSAHTTVLGSGNTKASGDWVQTANPELEKAFGGKAMTVVATLGRTQPSDRGCNLPAGTPEDEKSLCALKEYSGRVVARAKVAVQNARQIPGDPIVKAQSYLITDTATNALILGLDIVGGPIGAPVNRAMTSPWLTGNVLGTVSATARFGDVLFSSMPGEAYPQIPLKVREIVGNDARGFMTAGLANDQLGYIIAPYESYPEPIRRSFFDNGTDQVPTGMPSPIDNDNYFFNVSPTLGERLTCSLLRGAGDVFGKGSAYYRDQHDQCIPFQNDAAMPAGADVQLGTAADGTPPLP
jgi:hypothetical protein